jgi:hypothetical protein
MKMICISNDNSILPLEIGKEYVVFDQGNIIINNLPVLCYLITINGYLETCQASYFLTIEEYRDKKLEELGI